MSDMLEQRVHTLEQNDRESAKALAEFVTVCRHLADDVRDLKLTVQALSRDLSQAKQFRVVEPQDHKKTFWESKNFKWAIFGLAAIIITVLVLVAGADPDKITEVVGGKIK